MESFRTACRWTDPSKVVHSRAEAELLTQYEDACTGKEGGAFLREQGLYSSQIAEWRKLRDAGALTGKKPGETIGKLSAEQAESRVCAASWR